MFLRYQQVSRIIDLVKPTSLIEIGTWNGDHALIMAAAALRHNPRVHYCGYDLFETATAETDGAEFNVRSHHSLEKVRAKLAAFQAAHSGFTFDLIRGDTRTTLTDRVADFAYIDGGHSIATIASDYARLKGCPTIVFDDYYDRDDTGRQPDLGTVGCNKVLQTIPHVVLPAFDTLSSGGRVFMAAAGTGVLELMARDAAPPEPASGVRRAVVTTFAPDGYYDYGKRFVESFERYWPKDVALHLYLEAPLPLAASPRVHALNMLQACPEFVDFKKRHAGDRRAHGEIDGAPEDYRFNAVKFCHKVFALTHAALTLDVNELYWIDADSITFRPVTHAFLDGLRPAGTYTSYLGRRARHSECGFMAFDLRHAMNREFMEFWASIYAQDQVFELPEWHDSYIYDVVRRYCEDKGMIVSHDLRTGFADDHHPFVNSPLGHYMDHLIGPRRKLSGCSYALDLRSSHAEFYWKTVPWAAEDLLPLAAQAAGRRAARDRSAG